MDCRTDQDSLPTAAIGETAAGRAPGYLRRCGEKPARPEFGAEAPSVIACNQAAKVQMINASQLRAGMAIRYQSQDYKVVTAEYHPGQGKMGGVTHARLQNLATGTFWEYSFRSDLKLEEMPVEKHMFEFLYADRDQCCFMNPETYEQIEIARASIGPRADFLQPGMKLGIESIEGRLVNVLLPDVVEVKIADTAPPTHQQQDSTFKPAKLENGIEVMVPQFLKAADVIRLDLQTMKYLDRVRTDSKPKNA